MAAKRQWTALLLAGGMMSGCYYHAMAGPALAVPNDPHVAGVVTVSGGLNGATGGLGINANGSFSKRQSSGMLGVEAFRIWRSRSETGFQPYVRAALGLLEVGLDQDQTFIGAMSPRLEGGLMWLDQDLKGLTLGAAAEYRFRDQGLSTPVFSLQLGFGGFDFFGSSAGQR